MNTAIPMQVIALTTLRQSDLPLTSYISQVFILLAFITYPFVIYFYLDHNLNKLIVYQRFPDFNKSHHPVFSSISFLNPHKIGLLWIVYYHYRRILYSVILTILPNFQGI